MRAVVRNGQVLERNDYYPYGGRHENPSLAADAANRWRFSGKELQTTAGVNLLDFGARLYDDRLCRWTTRDPMSEKYYGFSPYNYCAGDPVNLVDPEGEKLYFVKGSSEEFKKHFADAVKIMNEKGTSYNLAKLENSKQKFYIQEGVENSFDKSNSTITWAPDQVWVNESTFVMISPITALAHESSHANAYREAVESGTLGSFNASTKKDSDVQFGTKEEKRVITTDEQTAAKRHGEIANGQVTRNDHAASKVIIVDNPNLFKSMSQSDISNYVSKHNLTLF